MTSECFTSRDYSQPQRPTPSTSSGRSLLYRGCFRVLGFEKLTREAQFAVRAWQSECKLKQAIYEQGRARWLALHPGVNMKAG